MTINELIMKIEDTAHLHEKEASFYKNMLSVLYGLIAEEACEEACEEDNYDIDSFCAAETNQTALEQIDIEEAAYIEDERIGKEMDSIPLARWIWDFSIPRPRLQCSSCGKKFQSFYENCPSCRSYMINGHEILDDILREGPIKNELLCSTCDRRENCFFIKCEDCEMYSGTDCHCDDIEEGQACECYLKRKEK